MKRSSDSQQDVSKSEPSTEQSTDSAEPELDAQAALGGGSARRDRAAAEIREDLGNQEFQRLVESGEIEEYLPEKRS